MTEGAQTSLSSSNPRTFVVPRNVLLSIGRTFARFLPSSLSRTLATWLRRSRARPPIGRVRFGDLGRLNPISRDFGFDRGRPVDRYYIERFLSAHVSDIRGRVLEIGGDKYTRMFGGKQVAKSDVLHLREGVPGVTLVADLTRADHLPSNAFDCILFIQTLQHIYDVRAALQTLYRILRPEGVLLATFNGIGKISGYDMERWGDYWRFTTMSVHRLLEESFPPDNVAVEARGNVVAAVAFMHGIAAEELAPEELNHRDPEYQILIGARALKPSGGSNGNEPGTLPL